MKKAFIAASGSLVLLLGACSSSTASSSKFRSETEKFLESSTDVREKLGETFSDADCVSPADNKVGTTYTCTANDATGAPWNFSVSITSKNGFTVDSGVPASADTDAGSTDTLPGDADTTTTTG